jgi:transcriptional regulator with XRE-family HTH domain
MTLTDSLLSERLQKAREMAGIPQKEAARRLGISPPRLSQYESGKRRVAVVMLDELSRMYRVPITYFFDGGLQASRFSLRRIAEMIGVSNIELEEMINAQQAVGTVTDHSQH